jgi:4'-phosphopantetheinyl transferase
MTEVYWLEQTEADIPHEDDWLSTAEALRQSTLRFAKRRADWRLGRWTAKCAVAAYLNLPDHVAALADIEIRPAPSGAPEVFLANQPAAVTISLSHRAGTAICAVAPSGVELGCDLEMIEPRSDAFVADYFTNDEQALVAQASTADRSRLLALLWSGKESALKALRAGLRLDTRSVMVCPEGECQGDEKIAGIKDPTPVFQPSHDPGCWHPLQVRCADRVFHGWWQCSGNLLRTVVGAPPPAPPILLEIPTGHAVTPFS